MLSLGKLLLFSNLVLISAPTPHVLISFQVIHLITPHASLTSENFNYRHHGDTMTLIIFISMSLIISRLIDIHLNPWRNSRNQLSGLTAEHKLAAESQLLSDVVGWKVAWKEVAAPALKPRFTIIRKLSILLDGAWLFSPLLKRARSCVGCKSD